MDVTKTCPINSKRKVPPIAKQLLRFLCGDHFVSESI
jgi:hypothetical protein